MSGCSLLRSNAGSLDDAAPFLASSCWNTANSCGVEVQASEQDWLKKACAVLPFTALANKPLSFDVPRDKAEVSIIETDPNHKIRGGGVLCVLPRAALH